MDGVLLGAGAHGRLETLAIRYVDACCQQVFEVVSDSHVLVDADARIGSTIPMNTPT